MKDRLCRPGVRRLYDLKAEEIDLDEEGFVVMCMDSLERYEVYEDRSRLSLCAIDGEAGF